MYRDSGSRQVEVWDGIPIKNVQLEFNATHHEPVLIRAFTDTTVSVGESATEAALNVTMMINEKNQEKEHALEVFQMETKKRLVAWERKQAELKELEYGLNVTKTIQVPLNDTFDGDISQDAVNAQNDKHKAVVDTLRQSQNSEKSDSTRARQNLLRFTKVSSSIKEVSESEKAGDKYSPTPYMESESDSEMLSPQSLESTQGANIPVVNSSFIGREAFQDKERVAQYQLQVKKKEAAFERLQARRKRAQAQARKQSTKMKNELDFSVLSETIPAVISTESDHEPQHEVPTPARSMSSSVTSAKSQGRDKGESIRYITALQRSLEAMVKQRGSTRLPQLCACAAARVNAESNKSGETDVISGAPWEQCANNCRFYNNPNLYARELADLFRSLDFK